MDSTHTDLASGVLDHLRSLESRGPKGLVAQLIDSLLIETSEKLLDLREAAARGDFEGVFRNAHSLQGSAAMVGALATAKDCAALVHQARLGDVSPTHPAVRKVEAGFETIRHTLLQWAQLPPLPIARPEPPVVMATSSAGRRKRVLVIDDDTSIRTITQILVENLGHEVESARDGIEGLAKLKLDIDLVLLDVVMPGLDGFDVCRRIRQDPHGRDVPVIMVTSLETREHRLEAVQAGASDFIAKPVDETELRIRSKSLLTMKEAQDELKLYQSHLEQMCEDRTSSLRHALEAMAEAQRLTYEAQLETVERLAILAEYKDKVTARHIQRMSEYCAVIARSLGLPEAEVELILHASRMHDVGKVAIPESILRKTSSLDQSEWHVMRGHSVIGGRILDNSTSKILQAGHVIALHHHERWDGGGYPNGLAGADIPLWGRICAVGDVFDAVTSARPYKPAFPNDQALQVLKDGRGKHFDPRVVDAFFESLDDILAIQQKFKDQDKE